MKPLIVSCVFMTTALIGLLVSESPDFSVGVEHVFRHKCARLTDETSNRQLFTLPEANNLLRKKVISKDKNFRHRKIGRIISFETVAPDRFLVEIYWGNGADDESSTVSFHDKERFLRDFEIID